MSSPAWIWSRPARGVGWLLVIASAGWLLFLVGVLWYSAIDEWAAVRHAVVNEWPDAMTTELVLDACLATVAALLMTFVVVVLPIVGELQARRTDPVGQRSWPHSPKTD